MNRVAKQLVDLLDSCGTRLHALLAKFTARRDVADELLQDLFVRILRTSGIVEAPNPEAYLFRAAINLAFDWRKRTRRTPVFALLEDDVATRNSCRRDSARFPIPIESPSVAQYQTIHGTLPTILRIQLFSTRSPWPVYHQAAEPQLCPLVAPAVTTDVSNRRSFHCSGPTH